MCTYPVCGVTSGIGEDWLAAASMQIVYKDLHILQEEHILLRTGEVRAGPLCREWGPTGLLAVLTWWLASPTLAGLNLTLTLFLMGRDALKVSSQFC